MVSKFDTSALEIDEGYLGSTLTDEGDVRCVFSSMNKTKVGTGSTTRSHITKLYWFVEEIGDEKFSRRQINSNHVPAGEEKIIHLKDLLSTYLPEIEFWEDKTVPAMSCLEDYLEDGEIDREDGKLYSAESSFQKALGLEEKNVRALFNLGLIYLELDEEDKARDMMNELLKIKSSFVGKDQHLFNDLGISLRKRGMFDESAAYYSQALEYIGDDEHLFYNLSRAHYERGDWPQCVNALGRCKALNPDLPAARDLSELVVEMSNNPVLCRKHGKPPISDLMAAGILGALQGGSSMEVERGDVLKSESGHVRTGGGIVEMDEKYDDYDDYEDYDDGLM